MLDNMKMEEKEVIIDVGELEWIMIGVFYGEREKKIVNGL